MRFAVGLAALLVQTVFGVLIPSPLIARVLYRQRALDEQQQRRSGDERFLRQKAAATFPVPSPSLPQLVQKARFFAHSFFTEDELLRLHETVEAARRTGADRQKIRSVVNDFVNDVFDHERKVRFAQKRSQIIEDFGEAAISRSFSSRRRR